MGNNETATVNGNTISTQDDQGNTTETITLDQTQLDDMFADAAFTGGNGLDKNQDYQRFTGCGNLGNPSLAVADIIAAFNTVAADANTNWGKLESALKDFTAAVDEWANNNKPKKAGQELDSALKNLAKAAGC